MSFLLLFFFFQAEDGIRDGTVTGVQTCALPISVADLSGGTPGAAEVRDRVGHAIVKDTYWRALQDPGRRARALAALARRRSEERRVGEGGKARRAPQQ